ncbi:MAG: hypothetical protein IAE80_00230, partial [Anaerolinea sp.]|nr:hypothetical protein [Anaerolinea sp.]
AAPGGVLVSYTLNEAGCYVDITAQVEDAGFYAINLWDDGNFRAGAGADLPAGGTFTVRFTIGGPILQGATGIGVYLEDAVGAAAANTYDSDGSAELWPEQVGLDCSETNSWGATVIGASSSLAACPVPRPVGSVIYSVPAGAPTFFQPNDQSRTTFNLPAGTWYISEFSGDWARVWIACQANMVWIPANAVAR